MADSSEGPPFVPPGSDRPRPGSDLLSTLDLLERFKSGDQQAVALLVERSIPPLRRWARGRLPGWARGIAETQDLVQTALMRALPRLKEFQARHPGALQAYLRQAVANHIRDEIRKVSARPPAELGESQPDPSPSPLEQAIGREAFDATKRRSRRYAPATAKPSSPGSSCSKATRKSRLLFRNRTPMPRAWRWPAR